MRIVTLDEKPFHLLRFRAVSNRGRIEEQVLPITRTYVSKLPEGLEAIVATSDLQGIVDRTTDGQLSAVLLGEALADELVVLSQKRLLPDLSKVGVILCGDLFIDLDLETRGGIGDVRPVWRAFAKHCKWVLGVAGNHDVFGIDHFDLLRFYEEERIALLEERIVNVGGLRCAGVGGIMGNPNKPQRRKPKHFMQALSHMLRYDPDVLILHEGPSIQEAKRIGNHEIRRLIEEYPVPLVMCGHRYWKYPFASLPTGTQIANLDHRVLIFQTW